MNDYNKEGSPLSIKSYQFAVNIVNLVKNSQNDWRIKSLFDQMLRSGTSIAANIHESEFAQRYKKDCREIIALLVASIRTTKAKMI